MLSKYGSFIASEARTRFERAIQDDQPVYQFADNVWSSRNAFRDILRLLEQREDRIQDSYLMQAPEKERFGR